VNEVGVSETTNYRAHPSGHYDSQTVQLSEFYLLNITIVVNRLTLVFNARLF